jgi:SAM-dependent methyltransferase
MGDIAIGNHLKPLSYPEGGNAFCAQIEDKSFWFQHRNECILSAIDLIPPMGPILEIGGGNGFVARALFDHGYKVVLLEPGMAGARYAKQIRHIPEVICSTFEDANFPKESFGAVGLFDVLEHLEDDKAMIQKIYHALRPRGCIYATVPAYKWLWSESDVYACHFRRYDQLKIFSLLQDQFELAYFTYFFQVLTLPIFLLRALPYRLRLNNKSKILSNEAEHGVEGGRMIRFISLLLSKEVKTIQKRRSVSFGASCLFVGRKIIN